MPTVDLDFTDIFEEAFERAGMTLRTGYELKSIRRSFNILMNNWANKGLNLWTVEEGTLTTTVGTKTETLPTDTVDLIEATVRAPGQNNEINLNRVAVGTYAKQAVKSQAGRPTQYFVERLIAPQVTFWPVPDQAYTIRYWRIRRLDGLASGINGSPDIPSRFIEPLCSGLAYQVAKKSKEQEVLQRLPLLKADYDEAFAEAAFEDRDRASYYITPGGYR